MRRIKNYSLKRQPFMQPVLTYRDRRGKHSVEVNAGKLERIEVFRDGENTYVLSWNQAAGYMGVQVFRGLEELGEVVQNQRGLESAVGNIGVYVPPLLIVKTMAREFERRYGSRAHSRGNESKAFKVRLKDLIPEARVRYREFVKGEAPRGSLAIVERPEEEER